VDFFIFLGFFYFFWEFVDFLFFLVTSVVLFNIGPVTVCVYYCRTFYKAVRVGEEESGGHVL
jgi:hypothetical protein